MTTLKAMVAAGRRPWAGGFAVLRDSPLARSDYRVRGPVPVLTRDPKRNVGKAELESDANAAYQNAIVWVVTGDAAHAAAVASSRSRARHGLRRRIDGTPGGSKELRGGSGAGCEVFVIRPA